jgi:hypothetical protein
LSQLQTDLQFPTQTFKWNSGLTGLGLVHFSILTESSCQNHVIDFLNCFPWNESVTNLPQWPECTLQRSLPELIGNACHTDWSTKSIQSHANLPHWPTG